MSSQKEVGETCIDCKAVFPHLYKNSHRCSACFKKKFSADQIQTEAKQAAKAKAQYEEERRAEEAKAKELEKAKEEEAAHLRKHKPPKQKHSTETVQMTEEEIEKQLELQEWYFNH